MPGVYLIQHEIQGDSGLPEDRYVNTFHVRHFTTGEPVYADWATDINFFYQGNASNQVHELFYWMSGALKGCDTKVKIYRLSDPTPAPAVYEAPFEWSTGTPNNASVPYEVAFCLSYRAQPAPGQSIARYRGRIYLGPMGENSLTFAAKPNPQMAEDVRDSAVGLRQALGTHGGEWIVYSPTRSGVAGAQTDGQIIEFSTDDAWDTQRRRGLKPTARIRVPALPG